jgi:hypothetical protein
VPDHLLGYRDLVVYLAIVDVESEAYKVRQDGGGAGLGTDRARPLTGHWAHKWETMTRKADCEYALHPLCAVGGGGKERWRYALGVSYGTI